VKGVLRPSNAKMLYMDKKSTEKGEVNLQKNRKVKGGKKNRKVKERKIERKEKEENGLLLYLTSILQSV